MERSRRYDEDRYPYRERINSDNYNRSCSYDTSYSNASTPRTSYWGNKTSNEHDSRSSTLDDSLLSHPKGTDLVNDSNPEELDPKTMEFHKLVELLHPTFIEDYLDRILTFLKRKQAELCFPNIAPFKESFLVKLVTDKRNLSCSSFNGTSRSICKEIIKVLDQNRKTYEWVHSYESGFENKCVLVYQKVNKKEDSKSSFKVPLSSSEKSRQQLSNNTISANDDNHKSNGYSSSSPDVPSSQGLTRRQRSCKNLFVKLTKPFVMSSLQSVVDFINDESRSTLTFKNMCSEQYRYLKMLNRLPFDDAPPSVFPTECTPLLTAIKRATESISLCCTAERWDKRHKIADVIITKESTDARDKKRKNSSRRTPDRTGRRTAEPVDYNPREMFMKALSASTDSEDSADACDKPVTNKSQDVGRRPKRYGLRSRLKLDSVTSQDSVRQSSCGDRKTEQRYNQTANGIQWQPATEKNSDVTNETQKQPDLSSATKRNSKLAQALSVPVEIDVAVRMMRRMKWDGGPLGTRGDGITEPIMPAIHIVSGAGLGHSPSITGKKRDRNRDSKRRTPADFRRDVLDVILDLLRNKDMKSNEIDVPRGVSRKELRFVKVSLKGFNARKNIGLNLKEEIELVDKIYEILDKDPSLGFDYSTPDSRKIVIYKETMKRASISKRKRGTHTKHKDDVTYTQSDTDVSMLTNPVIITQNDLEQLMMKLSNSRSNQRLGLKGLAFRMIIFENILNFVKSDNEEFSMIFKSLLNQKQCSLIENLVTNLNSRLKCSYSTRTENDLFNDIRMNLRTFLSLKFCTHFRYFTLRKGDFDRDKNTSRIKNEIKAEECNNNKSIERERDKHRRKRDRNIEVVSDSEDSVISLECDDYFMSSDEEDDDDDSNVVKNQVNKLKVGEMTINNKINDDIARGVVVKTENVKEHKVSNENSNSNTRIMDKVSIEHEPMSLDDVVTDPTPIDTGHNLSNTTDVRFVKNSVNDVAIDLDKEINNTDQTQAQIATNILEKEDATSNPSPGSGKRSRSVSQSSEILPKRPRIVTENEKFVAIKPQNADVLIDTELAGQVQETLASNLEEPLENLCLKCHGIIDGCLVYQCDNSNTLLWLERVVQRVFIRDIHFDLIDTTKEVVKKSFSKIKMAVKSNIFFEESAASLFKRLKFYHHNLKTDNWNVIEVSKDRRYNFIVLVDYESFELISDSNYSLYAGIDKVEFSRIWD